VGVDVWVVLDGPVGRGDRVRDQGGGQVAELVPHPGHLACTCADHQSVTFEFAQCEREHALRDPRNVPPQPGESQSLTVSPPILIDNAATYN